MVILKHMQKFILFILASGLAFFLYLLQTGHISSEDFSIDKFKGNTSFEIRKNTENIDTSVNRSDIYAIIKDQEYKIFTFEGNDFKKLFKYQFVDNKYKVPVDALDAVTGTWVGNRYVFYIKENTNKEKNKVYEIYKAEYPTDQLDKLQYFKIKIVEDKDLTNQIEVTY